MNTVISILFNTTFGKWYFTSIYSLTTVLVIQDSQINNQSFFDSLLKNVPAQVLYVLGIIYAIVVVLKYMSKAYKDHVINMLDIKMKKQKLEQEIIHTEKDNKELEK